MNGLSSRQSMHERLEFIIVSNAMVFTLLLATTCNTDSTPYNSPNVCVANFHAYVNTAKIHYAALDVYTGTSGVSEYRGNCSVSLTSTSGCAPTTLRTRTGSGSELLDRDAAVVRLPVM